MRTVIFFGLIAIADAINKDWAQNDENVIMLGRYVLVWAVIMDVIEFIFKLRNKKIK